MRNLFASCAALCLLAGCGSSSFHVTVPPSFREAPPSISVVGVYREGRWAPDTWEQLAPVVGRAVSGKCDQGYGEVLHGAEPQLYDDIDSAARQEGVTEDVLARFEPAAQGDVLMVLQLYGPIGLPPPRVRQSGGGGGAAPPPPAARQGYSRGAGMGGTMGRTPMTSGTETPTGSTGPNVVIAASLYSRKEHAFVGEVALTYSGRDVDAALRAFGDRLSEALHGSKCAGWQWQTAATATTTAAAPAEGETAPKK